MPLRAGRSTPPSRRIAWAPALPFALAALGGGTVHAQPVPAGWQACAAETSNGARLACYDRWARSVAGDKPATPALPPAGAPAGPVAQPAVEARSEPVPAPGPGGCHDTSYSDMSRFWELERATGCGVFGIRSYRPISLSVIGSDTVNRQPTSENPLNDAAAALPYRTTETRIQLSVRTKLAEGLLTQGELRDSLWFGYTQSSTWQVFTGALSRPFRNTDHEPEIVYAYPFQLPSVQGWRLRYGGIGIVHQSNGQSLPLSRSWNRVYLMAGAAHGGLSLQGRVWQRLNEDSPTDDNPGISNFIGRAEATGSWRMADGQTLSLTVRHSLRTDARGSVRLEWMLPIGDELPGGAPSSMRLHAQLFSGYGDSLLDYNRRRTVFSLGLSLVDW
jgi:phospholipase A1/A2